MDGIDKKAMGKDLLTQEYSVLITDAHRSSCGSGVLYYQGNEVYVFTCAHVVDMLEDPMEIHILVPQNRSEEEYQDLVVSVRKSQIAFSPLDEVSDENHKQKHSIDAAVIYFSLNQADNKGDGDNGAEKKKYSLQKTKYYIAESSRGENVFFQGYPGGQSGEDILDSLDISYAAVLHSVKSKHHFTLKLHDDSMDQSNRLFELEGFSGSPVWSADKVALSMLGLIVSGEGQTVYRNKVNAIKASVIRNIMKSRFDISMETRLLSVPEQDIAGGYEEIAIDGTMEINNNIDSIYDKWLVAETEKVKASFTDLQFQKAIDIGKAAVQNAYFDRCNIELIQRHFQHLLYCYESCFLDADYKESEAELVKRGIILDHDPMRWMTKNFGQQKYEETIEYTKKIIKENTEKESIVQLAHIFNLLSRAFMDIDSLENTVLKIVDTNENLVVQLKDAGLEALIYQMVGHVYSNHYRKNAKAVRCLNRAYRMGSDYAVLESLACAYYFLAIEKAVREDNTVDMQRIDKESLNKAKECFLILMQKADELYYMAMLKREGMVIFDVFFFSQDNYRILSIYPKLKSVFPSNATDKEKRDFELKYAKVVCQSGAIDLSTFHSLTQADKVLLASMSKLNGLLGAFEHQAPSNLAFPGVAQSIDQVIDEVEGNICQIEIPEREHVRILLINLYAWRKRIFNLDVSKDIERHICKLKEEISDKTYCGALMTSLSDFVFENTHTKEEAEQGFVRTFEVEQSFGAWMELLNFYKRNGLLDKADDMFKDLFDKHSDLIKAEEEYAYRAYILYIVEYRRDIKDALSFFLKHETDMKDADIRDFWRYELMSYTNSFNNPKEFEEERCAFADKGLISENEFHRMSLVAYMCNLDAKNAWRHFSEDNPFFGEIRTAPVLAPNGARVCLLGQPMLTREGAQFLVWQKKFPPHMETDWEGMLPTKAKGIWDFFENNWSNDAAKVFEHSNFGIERTICIDAWGMFLLTSRDLLGDMSCFDAVYVTHSTITRILEDICHYKNPILEAAVAWIENMDNVRILSPDFEHQLTVRNKAKYYEPESTVALALQLNCPAVIGEPELGQDCIDVFGHIIIRPNQISEAITCINEDKNQ